ncbi:MAG: MFS transporter [Methanomassiliicoccales archaeon]
MGAIARASYIQLASSAGLSGAALLVPNLLRGEFNASLVQIGFITAGFNTALFASSYVFGRLSDVRGRRLILQGGLALTAIALFTLVFARDTTSVAFVRILVGLCSGIYPSALLAHVYESDKKVGKFSAFGSLGFGLGTFLAGMIGMYYEIFFFSALLLFAAFAISLTMPFGKEKHHSVPFFPAAVIKRNYPVYLSVMFRHIGANMIWVVYTLFLADLGASPLFIGIIYAVNAAGQFIFMQFVDQFDSKRLVFAGFVFSIITFPSYTLATEFWMIIPAQIGIAGAWSCLYVGSVKYIMERNEEKGTSAGMLQASLSISAIIGAVFGGMIAFAIGYHGTMYIATVLAIIGLIIFFYTNKWMEASDRKAIRE